MHRWQSNLLITLYVGALGFGLVAHSMTFLKACHPAMYFIVWDMFCGWSAYESRLEIVGEGDSGTYYELSPGPWGGIYPFGSAERRDYDTSAQFGDRLAANTLRLTDHEPIRRIYVVEKSWAKKYNLPPAIWNRRYEEPLPERPRCYYHVRAIYNDRGECLRRASDWLTTQFEQGVLDNPRLRADVRKGHTFFAASPTVRDGGVIQQTAYETESP